MHRTRTVLLTAAQLAWLSPLCPDAWADPPQRYMDQTRATRANLSNYPGMGAKASPQRARLESRPLDPAAEDSAEGADFAAGLPHLESTPEKPRKPQAVPTAPRKASLQPFIGCLKHLGFATRRHGSALEVQRAPTLGLAGLGANGSKSGNGATEARLRKRAPRGKEKRSPCWMLDAAVKSAARSASPNRLPPLIVAPADEIDTHQSPRVNRSSPQRSRPMVTDRRRPDTPALAVIAGGATLRYRQDGSADLQLPGRSAGASASNKPRTISIQLGSRAGESPLATLTLPVENGEAHLTTEVLRGLSSAADRQMVIRWATRSAAGITSSGSLGTAEGK